MRIAPVIRLSPEQRTLVGIPSAEPLAAVARGGAVSHRVVRGRGPAGVSFACKLQVHGPSHANHRLAV